MAGPKGGKPSGEGMTLGDMGKLAVEMLPGPMREVTGFAKQSFDEVAARQAEESRAPALETGPSPRNAETPGPNFGNDRSFNANVASFLVVPTGHQRDAEVDAAVNGPSPPKPPGM